MNFLANGFYGLLSDLLLAGVSQRDSIERSRELQEAVVASEKAKREAEKRWFKVFSSIGSLPDEDFWLLLLLIKEREGSIYFSEEIIGAIGEQIEKRGAPPESYREIVDYCLTAYKVLLHDNEKDMAEMGHS